MRNRLPLILLVLLGFCLLGSAQTPGYQFNRIDLSQGLSHNQVNCIFKDSIGFMWFGTMSGLNRYDGYNFKIFRRNSGDSITLADDYISEISEAPFGKLLIQTRNGNSIYCPLKEGFINIKTYLHGLGLPGEGLTDILRNGTDFWFVFPSDGLYKMNAAGKTELIWKVNSKLPDVEKEIISDIKIDSKGNLVIIYRNGIIEKLDTRVDKPLFRSAGIQKEINNQEGNFSLFLDNEDDAWIYIARNPLVPNNPLGVLYFDFESKQLKKVTKESGIVNNNIINGMIQDDSGRIWIGTDHGGINILDKKTFKSEVLTNIEDDKRSISQNSVYALYKDDKGIIWLGTYKQGLCYYRSSIIKFPVYQRRLSDPGSLSYQDVNKFVEDDKGNLWIGTNGGGLLYFNRQTNIFTQYRHNPSNTNSISNDVIVSLLIDHEKKLWIGSYFGGLDCYDGKTFTHYRHAYNDPTSLADDRVWEIYEDDDLNLWVGTVAGGLDRFDRKTKIFHHNRMEMQHCVSNNYISSLAQDSEGNLWIGTADGIDVIQKKTGKFIHYSVEKNGLSGNYVISLYLDRANNMWVGTRDGLNVFNRNTKKFQSFHIRDGLPDKNILNILGDNNGNLWVSTPNGMSKITVNSNPDAFYIKCQNYDDLDGLQDRQFNENAALRTSKGELIFGGDNGFNIFDPALINLNKDTPSIVLTKFHLFNKEITPGEKLSGHVILENAISHSREINLKYNQNSFSIEFAALSYSNTEKNKYAFMLEGFNSEWVTVTSQSRRATYTNLDPGEYTFRVKASNDDGLWNENGIALKITILPPFWKTPLAYAVYVLTAIFLLYLLRKWVIIRARRRFALEQERKQAHSLHELDLMKIKFLTNVSHEFRTPLSLILTPLDKIIKQTPDAGQRSQLKLIHRNARRLLNLVNQLLDFRKLEASEMKLTPSEGDIIEFIKDTSYSFTDLAEKKNISFSYESSVEKLNTLFDHDKIERVLFNLLSNAFKFTPENGKVNVDIHAEKSQELVMLRIQVCDNGIGIAKDRHDKIFERFFQNELPGSIVNQGSGIGLAITREFVKLHQGNITVESELNQGSCFTVELPLMEIAHVHNGKHMVSPELEMSMLYTQRGKNGDEYEAVNGIIPAEAQKLNGKKPIVLLVEDNEDFRQYLKENLETYFEVLEASNGKEGWNKALAMHPALIVSDISMPVMDGIELCKKIKNDSRTSFIPVILLTALTGEQQQLLGLQTGANDYITKPFNLGILLSKIQNLLKHQHIAKETYQKRVVADPAELKLDSPDEKFMRSAMEVLEKNIPNPDFSVEELSRQLFMSRMGLYKKLLSLTGKTPNEFIRYVRLKRAAQLLEQSHMTVSEVAYEVGFNNPKYFSKYFRTEFGVLPSAYQHQKNDHKNGAGENDPPLIM